VTDDAAVYQLDAETAIVQTVDFFPPVVDDPWTYGAIAAANAMSDVYAMGGEVVLCLNIAGFPSDMAPETISEVFRGGADKVAEGGGVIAGGHTVIDAEPKYGLSVMGTVHPQQILAKTGARPGDVLVLTKALGTGLILTGEAGAHAVTDVTGFAIAGHALEIADHSNVRLVLRAAGLPLLPGALDYALAGVDFGGVNRNRDYLSQRLELRGELSEAMLRLLYDPQTSGGLLMAVEAGVAPSLLARLVTDGYAAAVVGRVEAGSGLVVEA
jgi:selenide,water dikinase